MIILRFFWLRFIVFGYCALLIMAVAILALLSILSPYPAFIVLGSWCRKVGDSVEKNTVKHLLK
jgi:hypothetical protein